MTKENLIERIKKEGILILSEGVNNSVLEKLKNNPEIKDNNLMNKFAQKYGVITFSRIEKESKDELVVHISVIPYLIIITEN